MFLDGGPTDTPPETSHEAPLAFFNHPQVAAPCRKNLRRHNAQPRGDERNPGAQGKFEG
jgi:hypothetical protein